jgi:hypothetical protein
VLWAVVVKGLPQALARSLTRTAQLDDNCRRLAADGWTPEDLATALTDRNWSGAQHGGAVVKWLSGLGQPPLIASATRSAPRRKCREYGHEHEVLDANGVCAQCRVASRLRVSA